MSLASYRGRNVVLSLKEGASCDARLYRMRQFEQHAARLRTAGITVLPVVMNPVSQIRPGLASFGVHTPCLIDAGGAVSRASGMLAKACTTACPATGFALIGRTRHGAVVRQIPVHVPVHSRSDRTGWAHLHG